MPKYKPGERVYHSGVGHHVEIKKYTGSFLGHESYNVRTRTRKGKGPYTEANFSFPI